MKRSILCFVIMLFIGTTNYGQSKIKKAEESLTKKDETTVKSKSKQSDSGTNYNSNGNFFSDVIGGLFVQLFAYTAYGVAIETPFETGHQASNAFITEFPYNMTANGNYSYNWNEQTPIFRSALSTRYIKENSRLNGTHLNLDMRFLKRLGVEADYLQLWENNPNFGKDNLALYTILAKYHRVRTEKFNAYWGLGTTFIDGGVDAFGFTYGLGAELFFVKPMSVEANFNQSLLNSNTVNKFNVLLNYHKKQYKAIGGYEHLRIGNQNFSNVTLGLGVFF